jgi:hypothetical protein
VSKRFVDGVAVRRPATGGAVVRLIGAAGLLLVVVGLAQAALLRVEGMNIGTVVYRRAQWVSAIANVSLACVMGATATWLISSSLRAVLRLPVKPVSVWWFWIRAAAALTIMAVLSWWAQDEIYVRWNPQAKRDVLVMGLVLCALFWFDIPRLVKNGVACVRLIWPIRGVRRVAVADLPASGTVLIEGIVENTDGNTYAVFAPWLPSKPFIVVDGKHRVLVDPDSEVILRSDAAAEICAGDRLAIVGRVESAPSTGPFRSGGLARIVPSFLFAGGASRTRRFVVAAVVELASAWALVAWPIILVTSWLWIRSFVGP